MSRLATFRRSAGLTQDACAKLLGVSQPTISNIERGDALPSGRLAAKIEQLTQGEIQAGSWFAETPEGDAA